MKHRRQPVSQPQVFTKRDIEEAFPAYFMLEEHLGNYHSVIKGQVLIERYGMADGSENVTLSTFDGNAVWSGLGLPKSPLDEPTLFALASALTVQDIQDADEINSQRAAARLLVEKACQFYGKEAELALYQALGMETIECFKMVMQDSHKH
jgi:hypothetical protein